MKFSSRKTEIAFPVKHTQVIFVFPRGTWKRPAAVIPLLLESSRQSIYIKRKLEKTDIADLIIVDTGLVLFCEHLRMSQGCTVYQTVFRTRVQEMFQ